MLESSVFITFTFCQSLGPRQAREILVCCPLSEPSRGLSVAQALSHCHSLGLVTEEDYRSLSQEPSELGLLGIWGKRCTLLDAVQEGDRLEVYRPLLVDPKTARRERFKTQGAKTAGLFASRRPGAKPGY